MNKYALIGRKTCCFELLVLVFNFVRKLFSSSSGTYFFPEVASLSSRMRDTVCASFFTVFSTARHYFSCRLVRLFVFRDTVNQSGRAWYVRTFRCPRDDRLSTSVSQGVFAKLSLETGSFRVKFCATVSRQAKRKSTCLCPSSRPVSFPPVFHRGRLPRVSAMISREISTLNIWRKISSAREGIPLRPGNSGNRSHW